MRIWDLHAGYLARQQLLGEHSELHALYNILVREMPGYGRHPETLRWRGHLGALGLRHDLLAEEMRLRGYAHHSPLPETSRDIVWPETYLDTPGRQFELLRRKYAADHRSGRIPLPKNTQQVWAQHKYSVMAHAPDLYTRLGSEVAAGAFRHDMDGLILLLCECLRIPAAPGRVCNALQHMWGYVSRDSGPCPESPSAWLADLQQRAVAGQETYLLHSTALSELAVWI